MEGILPDVLAAGLAWALAAAAWSWPPRRAGRIARCGLTEHTHCGKSSKTSSLGHLPVRGLEQDFSEKVAELIERSHGAKVGRPTTVTPSATTEASLWKEKRNTGAGSGQ